MKYRGEIDGLRALAVVPVILFHAGFEFFSGGFVGVDVFFVISGYLITTILIEGIENNQFSITNFFERRAKRILPALFFIIIISYLVAWQFLNPFDLKEFAQSIFATTFFSSNIYFFLKTGYFDTAAELKPLLHTWSLAIEEQYYVIFPIFLISIWHFGKKKVFLIILAMTIISFLFAEGMSEKNSNASFFLLHTRAWELLSGSITAFIVQKNGVKKNNALSILGFFAIVFSILVYDGSTPYPGRYTLAPVLGVMLIIMYSNKDTYVAKILNTKAFISIGLVSYSAYLWHQPIFALARQYFVSELTALTNSILIIIILVLSIVTRRYIEQPVRKLKKTKFNRNMIFLTFVVGICAFSTVGLHGHKEKGYPERNPSLLRLAQNGGLSINCSGASIFDENCMSKKNPKILLWGDSHAMHLANALDLIFTNEGIQQLTLSACPPVPGFLDAPRKAKVSCDEFNSNVFQFLLQNELHNIETVILSSSRNLANPKLRNLFIKSINKLKKKEMSIILVSSTPRFSQSKKCITFAMRGNFPISECVFLLSNANNYNDFLELRTLTNELEISFVDLSEFMCLKNSCSLDIDGSLILRDEGHLTNEIQTKLSIFLNNKIKSQMNK